MFSSHFTLFNSQYVQYKHAFTLGSDFVSLKLQPDF